MGKKKKSPNKKSRIQGIAFYNEQAIQIKRLKARGFRDLGASTSGQILAARTLDGFREQYAVRLDGTVLRYKPERLTAHEHSMLPKINKNTNATEALI